MELKQHTLQELNDILQADYGIVLPYPDTNEVGGSLLRLTRVALAVLIRKNGGHSVPYIQRQRGRQRVPETTKPAEKRGAPLPPETSV